mmetsp:Transcript_10231/g.38002  ORF Transcript_10231/g.38002 Transcript_10231/m.38002 type:complete len:290 (+) Transcript_10231:964-1833(+)
MTSSPFTHVTQNLNRILYPNPVCLLTTFNESFIPNVMTITWLTAINAKSQFILSMNKKRFSAQRMKVEGLFGLQVPTFSQKQTILDIGAFCGQYFGAGRNERDHFEGNECFYTINDKGIVVGLSENGNVEDTAKSDDHCKRFSRTELLSMGPGQILTMFGRRNLKNRNHALYHLYDSKFEMLNLQTMHHFTSNENYSKKKYKRYLKDQVDPSKVPFVEGCCAHLVCGVLGIDTDAERDHFLIRAEILDAMVVPKYWMNGKIFHSHPEDPYLTFLGTQLFGKVVDLEHDE